MPKGTEGSNPSPTAIIFSSYNYMTSLSVSTTINAPKERVWAVISDISNAAERISGIDSVEILEEGTDGLIGLKWKETRQMFGQTATETMWITESVENEYYKTRAESHGAVYTSMLSIKEEGDKSVLTMEFGGEPQGVFTKMIAAITAPLVKGSTKKALQKDLEDIKAAVEQSA